MEYFYELETINLEQPFLDTDDEWLLKSLDTKPQLLDPLSWLASAEHLSPKARLLEEAIAPKNSFIDLKSNSSESPPSLSAYPSPGMISEQFTPVSIKLETYGNAYSHWPTPSFTPVAVPSRLGTSATRLPAVTARISAPASMPPSRSSSELFSNGAKPQSAFVQSLMRQKSAAQLTSDLGTPLSNSNGDLSRSSSFSRLPQPKATHLGLPASPSSFRK